MNTQWPRSLLLFLISAPAASSWQAMPMRQIPIVDTVLNMTAFTLTAPAAWNVVGAMVPNPSCSRGGPMPTFSAVAPDGLTGIFFLPRFDWAWGPGVTNNGDCLPVQQMISAKDFLTYFIRIKQLGFVREEPTPKLAEHQLDIQKLNRPGFTVTTDEAKFLVRYQIGAQIIDERVMAGVTCNQMTFAMGVQHHCNAMITRVFAPTGQLDAMLPVIQSIKSDMNPAWNEEWNATMVKHVKQLYQAQNQAMLARGQQANAARRRQHQDFMASMQRGRDLRNQQFRNGQFVKQQNKEDYVDYLLDCHRLRDGNNSVNIGNCGNRETPSR